MEDILLLALSFLVLGACSENSLSSGGGTTTPVDQIDPVTEVVLTVGGVSNLKSTFNFYYHTRDNFSRVDNIWDLVVFDNVDPLVDEFKVNLSAFSRGAIVDLGAKLCSSVALSADQQTDFSQDLEPGGVSESHRLTNPDYWLAFTDAMRTLQTAPLLAADVVVNHCYLLINTTETYTVTVLFSVSQIETEASSGDLLVTLSEIEYFNKKLLKK